MLESPAYPKLPIKKEVIMRFALKGWKHRHELPIWVEFPADNDSEAVEQAKRTAEASGWQDPKLYKIEEIKVDW